MERRPLAYRLHQAVGMATRALIGISGWRYTPWRGEFYPPGLPEREELRFAAERFPTIELNGSFYSLQRPEYYERWREQVPSDFIFAIFIQIAARNKIRHLHGNIICTSWCALFELSIFQLHDLQRTGGSQLILRVTNFCRLVRDSGWRFSGRDRFHNGRRGRRG